MDDRGNAADEFGAHLGQGGHRRHQEGIHTHITDHLFFPQLCLGFVTLETRKLRVLRDEDQLLGE